MHRWKYFFISNDFSARILSLHTLYWKIVTTKEYLPNVEQTNFTIYSVKRKETIMDLQQLKPLRIHLQEFLESVGADYQHDEDNHCYLFGMTSNGMNIKAFILYNEEHDWMRCHIPMPIKVPEEKRIATILLLNKKNYEVPGICLSMDEADGEVIATMVANTDDGAINHKIINAMIQTCYNVIDDCIPKVMRIIYQQPEDLLLQITGNQYQKSIAN